MKGSATCDNHGQESRACSQIEHPFGKGLFVEKAIDQKSHGEAKVENGPLTKVKVPEALTFPPDVSNW